MNTATALPVPKVSWSEGSHDFTTRWLSESGLPPPKRLLVVDDSLTADTAYHLACEGTGLLWRGDFQNARQLLQAMARRIDTRHQKKKPDIVAAAQSDAYVFHRHRHVQLQRSRILGMLLIPYGENYKIDLRRAPDVSLACKEAYGEMNADLIVTDFPRAVVGVLNNDLHKVSPPTVIAVGMLKELLGMIGAHEWRKKGVNLENLGFRIYPHYGVFSPLRSEYLSILDKLPLPQALEKTPVAFDIGTGSGVIAALLARRGIPQVIATDNNKRALVCAHDNLTRLGLEKQVTLIEVDMFAPGRAALIVCNPPWLPAKPASPIEHALYDPGHRMLKAYLNHLSNHLVEGGQGWLVMSNLAEKLFLRQPDELADMIEAAHLSVIERIDTRPVHKKSQDKQDALYHARAAEVTSVWRLKVGPI